MGSFGALHTVWGIIAILFCLRWGVWRMDCVLKDFNEKVKTIISQTTIIKHKNCVRKRGYDGPVLH